MAERIKFYMDEHVPQAVTEGLRRRGVDVLTPNDAGLLTVNDESHLAFALGRNRVIFTRDADFLRLHALGAQHSGIVYTKGSQRIEAYGRVGIATLPTGLPPRICDN